jgi:predicted porin
MKKTPVALAALFAAGLASAQSSVTLFGVVDTGISHYQVKSAFSSTSPFAVPPLVAPAGVKRSQTALSNSANSPSRIGFRGTEDLGGGLSASFWLEAPLSSDNGAVALGTFGRRSTVSFAGGFGEIRLGRDYTPTFWADTLFDPFGNNGVGANLIGTINANLAVASALAGGGALNGGISGGTDNYTRTSNGIGYFLPPNLGGFYGQLIYALHENTKLSDAVGPNPSKRGRYVGGRVGYENGPVNVAAAYTESTVIDALVAGAHLERKIKSAALSATYDFGPAKLFGELSQVKDDVDSSTTVLPFGTISSATQDKYTGAMLGVTVPIGPGQIKGSIARVKFKDDPGFALPSLFGANADASARKLALGYVHNLSKRTALYATAARIRIKNGQNNPVMAATTGGSPAYLSTGGIAPRSATGYDFGIRHAF